MVTRIIYLSNGSADGDTGEAHSTQAIPENTLLGNNYQIKRISREENHATVYGITLTSTPGTDNADVYEARAFNFKDLSPSYERYRRRAMKRLARRAVFRVSWDHFEVVVYKTGSLPPSTAVESKSSESEYRDTIRGDPVSHTIITGAQTKRRKPKTENQRELERLRQKRRRQGARQREIWPTLSQLLHSTRGIAGMCEKDFMMFLILHLAQDDLWKRVSPDTVSADMKSKIMHWRNDEPGKLLAQLPEGHDEAFLQQLIHLKQSEIITLKRQYNRYKPLETQWQWALKLVLHRQVRIPTGSPKWKEMMHNKVNPAKARLRVLQAGLKALPEIIDRAEVALQMLNKKLERDLQARIEKEKMDASTRARSCAMKRVTEVQTWMSLVVPGSKVHEHLDRVLKSTKRKMQ